MGFRCSQGASSLNRKPAYRRGKGIVESKAGRSLPKRGGCARLIPAPAIKIAHQTASAQIVITKVAAPSLPARNCV
jgi:hypothetical protein